jgi:hypothetical protein
MSDTSCPGLADLGVSAAELVHGATLQQLSATTAVGPNLGHPLVRKLELKALQRKEHPLQGGVMAIAAAQHHHAISQVAIPACQ